MWLGWGRGRTWGFARRSGLGLGRLATGELAQVSIIDMLRPDDLGVRSVRVLRSESGQTLFENSPSEKHDCAAYGETITPHFLTRPPAVVVSLVTEIDVPAAGVSSMGWVTSYCVGCAGF